MNRRLGIMIVALLVTASGWIAVIGAADDRSDSVSEALSLAESTESAVEMASETTWHYVSGAVMGIGLGMVVGGGLVFSYWKRKIG